MRKEELIHLHILLAQLKKRIDDRYPDLKTPIYDELGTSPSHIHKSKYDHKEAIFTLGEELLAYLENLEESNTLKEDELPEPLKRAIIDVTGSDQYKR